MGFLLFLISFILVGALAPIGLFFTLLKCIFLKDENYINNYYRKLAISLDQFGNVIMSGLFNKIMISGNKNLFGNEDETISSVLGKNKISGTLRMTGKILDKLLELIEKNHTIKSIEL